MRDRIRIGSLGGVPIDLHWTLPLGCWALGRFQFRPWFWLGLFIVLVTHELGHAGFVRWRRLCVTRVLIHGAGGECRYAGGTPFDRSVIAWGGVVAQLVLAVFVDASWASLRVAVPYDLFEAMVGYSLLLVILNLLPIGFLDGVEAWRLVPRWWKRSRRPTW